MTVDGYYTTGGGGSLEVREAGRVTGRLPDQSPKLPVGKSTDLAGLPASISLYTTYHRCALEQGTLLKRSRVAALGSMCCVSGWLV